MTGSRSLPSPGWRRVAAFGVDYAIILVYLGVLTLVGLLGRGVGVVPDDVTTPAGRVLAQLVVFAVLTVPVTGWFAGWERGPRGATPGKRLLGLRVLTTGGDRVAWPRSLLRTAVKFTIPWELAHTAVWNMLVWPGDRAAALDLVLLGVANAAIVVDVAMLFVGSRRLPTTASPGPSSPRRQGSAGSHQWWGDRPHHQLRGTQEVPGGFSDLLSSTAR